ncbi:hypothetical protein [Mesorhizobium sp. J428]|uniref:hypothetical protein n=1 Tax=Mesorhizobium sp. J428 TaxID=2898440 RepID=UPI0021517194|nr:hypothetical protein [Mesorhizobium sp. J428]MCR5857623.1 hypothetical protein [Mesorhizobium sp. J428]
MASRFRRSTGEINPRRPVREDKKGVRASDIIFGITLAMLISALLVRAVVSLFTPA